MGKSQEHQAILLFDYAGGKNTKYAEIALAENETVGISNYHLMPRGGVEKRKGLQLINSGDVADAYPIVGLHRLVNTAGTFRIRVKNAKFEWLSGSTWTNITGAEVVSTSADARWVFRTFRNAVVGTNGVDIPLKWSGTGNVSKITQLVGATATLTAAKTMCVHNSRLVLGDVTIDGVRYESRLQPSSSGTLDTWPDVDAGRIDISEGDGDSVTATFSVLGNLVVFKQHKLYRVTNYGISATQAIVKIADVGTPSSHGAFVVGTSIFFFDVVGRFWQYDVRGVDEDALIERSREKWGKITFDAMQPNRLPHAHLLHDPARGEIYFFYTLSNTSVTNAAHNYNKVTEGFVDYTWAKNFNVSDMWVTSAGRPQLVGGTSDGLVVELEQTLYDLDTTAIEARLKTRQISGGAIDTVKGLRKIHIYSIIDDATTVTVNGYLGLRGGIDFTEVITLEPTGDVLG